MDIQRSGSRPSTKGPTDYFTGAVRIDPLFDAAEPARTSAALVTFEPGARTAWHTHPLGQTIIVTAGLGRAQQAGGPVEEIRPGDIVWFPPGARHGHGAAPDHAMTHIAIAEAFELAKETTIKGILVTAIQSALQSPGYAMPVTLIHLITSSIWA